MQSQEWLLTHPVRTVQSSAVDPCCSYHCQDFLPVMPCSKSSEKKSGWGICTSVFKGLLKPLFPACHRSTKVMKRPCQHSDQIHKKNDLEEQDKPRASSGVKDFLHVRIGSSKPALGSWELFHIHSTCAEILLCQVAFMWNSLPMLTTTNRGLESSGAMVTHDWIITYSPALLTHAPTYGLASSVLLVSV